MKKEKSLFIKLYEAYPYTLADIIYMIDNYFVFLLMDKYPQKDIDEYPISKELKKELNHDLFKDWEYLNKIYLKERKQILLNY